MSQVDCTAPAEADGLLNILGEEIPFSYDPREAGLLPCHTIGCFFVVHFSRRKEISGNTSLEITASLGMLFASCNALVGSKTVRSQRKAASELFVRKQIGANIGVKDLWPLIWWR
jgi:hypothetical protein